LLEKGVFEEGGECEVKEGNDRGEDGRKEEGELGGELLFAARLAKVERDGGGESGAGKEDSDGNAEVDSEDGKDGFEKGNVE